MSGKVLSLDEARSASTGHLRALAERGLAQITIVAGADVVRRIALDTERLNNKLRDLSVTIALLLKRLEWAGAEFTQEEIIEALPAASGLGFEFSKEGGMRVYLASQEPKDGPNADAVGDGDAALDQPELPGG